MKVKIKKLHPDAEIPHYAHSTDAGMDLKAVRREIHGDIVTYYFGLAFEIPEGYAGFIYPRSSNYKQDLVLTNSVGVVDSGYRGEVCAKFKMIHKPSICGSSSMYNAGDRVAQMVIMPYPKIELEEAEELSESDRGANGYGSTGK